MVGGVGLAGYCAVTSKVKSALPSASGSRMTRHPRMGAVAGWRTL